MTREHQLLQMMRLTDEQQQLLNDVKQALNRLEEAGVMLIYDGPDDYFKAVNITGFEIAEICDSTNLEDYEGWEELPIWGVDYLPSYHCAIWSEDHIMAQDKRDINLFNN